MGFESIKKGLQAARKIASPMELVQMALPASVRTRRVLNDGEPSPEGPAGLELVEALRRLRNQLEGDAYVEGGVDYARLRGAPVYAELRELSRGLSTIRATDLEDDARRLAFWINLYNVLMIHGVIELGINDSVMERPTFFTSVAYRVGAHTFTPDDIEHGVLRRNAPHPNNKTVYFDADDPRRVFMVDELDPRIHVALVCVAQSCPPIAFYDAEKLDAQLDLAAENFVNLSVNVDPGRRVVSMSPIFKWYEIDFGGAAGLRAFLSTYADEPLRDELQVAFDDGYAWEYGAYDWSLNAL